MKKLLKQYDFNSDMQYFEMLIESHINGQHTQAKEQFKAMNKEYQKKFVLAISDAGNWNIDCSNKTDVYKFFFNLL